MKQYRSPLDHMDVAAPCAVRWEIMEGDDRIRSCAECNLNVYNISAMSRKEAEALLALAQGRLCVRFYRRADGTILTEDCPIGARAWRKTKLMTRAAVAALGAVAAGLLGMNSLPFRETTSNATDSQVQSAPEKTPHAFVTMGVMVVPVPEVDVQRLNDAKADSIATPDVVINNAPVEISKEAEEPTLR